MRIVATLTTLPNRYDKLLRSLKALHQQTVKFDVIYVTIPYVATRLGIKYPKIPKEIKKLCKVVRTQTDYGPLTKLYGALMYENDADTYILSFDDDAVYDNRLVEVLIEKAKVKKDAAICGTGWLLKHGALFFSMHTSVDKMKPFNGFIGIEVGEEGRALDCIQGTAGVLYRRGFFDDKRKIEERLFDVALTDMDLFKNDDVLISAYLCKRGVKKYVFTDIPVTTNYDADECALSRDAFKMLESFNQAVEKCKAMGWFLHFEDAEIADSPTFKMIMIAVFLFIILLVVAYAVYYYNYM